MTQLAPRPSNLLTDHVEANNVSEQVKQNRSRCHCQRPVSTRGMCEQTSLSRRPHSPADARRRAALARAAHPLRPQQPQRDQGIRLRLRRRRRRHLYRPLRVRRRPRPRAPRQARCRPLPRRHAPRRAAQLRGAHPRWLRRLPQQGAYVRAYPGRGTDGWNADLDATRRAASSARHCLASSQTTCRTTAFSRCACVPRAIRARAPPTLSTSRRRARRTTICGSTVCTLRATTAAGKTFLSVLFLFYCLSLVRRRAQIPFDGFVMTKAGTINTQPVSMLRERVRSVGVSLLGGNSGIEGPYELGIDEIRAVNEEDVTVPPRTFTISKSDVYASCHCFYSGQFATTPGTGSALGTRANMINALALVRFVHVRLRKLCHLGPFVSLWSGPVVCSS